MSLKWCNMCNCLSFPTMNFRMRRGTCTRGVGYAWSIRRSFAAVCRAFLRYLVMKLWASRHWYESQRTAGKFCTVRAKRSTVASSKSDSLANEHFAHLLHSKRTRLYATVAITSHSKQRQELNALVVVWGWLWDMPCQTLSKCDAGIRAYFLKRRLASCNRDGWLSSAN